MRKVRRKWIYHRREIRYVITLINTSYIVTGRVYGIYYTLYNILESVYYIMLKNTLYIVTGRDSPVRAA